MNQICILGRLGHDPETRTVGATSVTNVAIATSEKWKDKSGQKQEQTEWHRCQIWGPRGEAFARFHKQGDLALVCGSMHYRAWEDRDGHKRTSAEVKVRDWHFAGGGGGGGGGGGKSSPPPPSSGYDDGKFGDDEIPF